MRLLVRLVLVAATAATALLGAATAASAADPVCVLLTPPDGQGARPFCVG